MRRVAGRRQRLGQATAGGARDAALGGQPVERLAGARGRPQLGDRPIAVGHDQPLASRDQPQVLAVVRLAVLESPTFKAVKESGGQSEEMPIVELVKTQKRDLLSAMGMRIAENGCFYIFTVFVLAYGEDTLNLSRNTMLTGVIIAAALGLFTIPLYGALSDRFGRRTLYMAGALFALAFAFPFFVLLNTKEPVLIWLAIVLAINVGHDLMYGPQAAYFSELFATRMRYTGASIGYQLASVFGGGFAPLIAVALLAAGGGKPYLVAAYMVGMGVITVVATHFARETFQSDITDAGADEARPPTARFSRTPAEERETTAAS